MLRVMLKYCSLLIAFACLLSCMQGFCYGKFEAFLLSLVLPVFLLGHLSGLLPETAERGFAVLASALLTVFAARKYTQPVKDDIGDGSVFNFMKLSPEEQEAVVARLRDM